jgi:hypothetical protein
MKKEGNKRAVDRMNCCCYNISFNEESELKKREQKEGAVKG